MRPLFFIKFLFFTKWSPFKNNEKCFLFHLKNSFSSRDIQVFVFSSSPLFSLSVIALEGDTRKILKVYDVLICLNKNLITCFFWYLEKEIRCDIETLAIDRVLNAKHYYGKNHAENVYQKLVPDPFLVLPNNPKQILHAGNSFENKTFWKMIIKKPLKSQLYFFFRILSLLRCKVIKNKKVWNYWPVTFQVTKHVQKNSSIRYILSDQVWWRKVK